MPMKIIDAIPSNKPGAAPGSPFRGPPAPRRGLGIAELLVCLVISSMLLTAVAMAYQASFNSFRDSQERGQMLNTGRGFMTEVIQDIRMSDAGGPYDPSASISSTETSQFGNQIVPGNPTSGPSGSGGSGTIGVQLVKYHADSIDPTASASSPVTITYWFDAPNEQILMTRHQGSVTNQFTVCTCVQSLTFYLQPVLIPANAQTGTAASMALLRGVVSITMANKDSTGKAIISQSSQNLTLTFSDAAMPRRTFGGV